MRILFVSNYYPPHYVGGYELECARVAQWLALAGHDVRVLTSDFQLTGPGPENGIRADRLSIHRELRLRYWRDVTDAGYWLREWRDLRIFRRHLAEFRPDIVVLWNMRKLAAGIVLEAQRSAPLLVYHLMDEWPANFRGANGLPQFWARPAGSAWGRLLKPVLRAAYHLLFTPDASCWRPENAVLVSNALGELVARSGVKLRNTHVSYITYDPALFDPIDWNRESDPPAPVRFLWAGRLCAEKGLVTTLNALDALWAQERENWEADFCGPISAEDMNGILRPRLEVAPWRARVRYLGSIPHEEMPRQYRAHDAFLFTSEVHEGLPGVLIEAFAAVMPVIGTLTGGTRDVLRPGENCLMYPMGDAAALAGAMLRLIREPGLRKSLSANVSQFAREHCSTEAVFPRLVEFYRNLLKE